MFNNCPVDYVELIVSGGGEISAERETAKGEYLVNWSDAYTFASWLIGGPQRIGLSTVYEPPQAHPVRTHLYAKDVTISGLGTRGMNPDGTIKFEKATVSVNFETMTNQESGGDSNNQPDNIKFITESRDIIGNKITVPEGQFKWATTENGTEFIDTVHKDDAYIAINEMWQEIAIEIAFWFSYPDDDEVFMSMAGKINKADYKPLLTTYKKHTLLFNGVTRRRQFTSQGASSWEVTFKFMYNPRTWRKFYRSSRKFQNGDVDTTFKPGYYPMGVKIGDTIRYPLEEADFTTLRP